MSKLTFTPDPQINAAMNALTKAMVINMSSEGFKTKEITSTVHKIPHIVKLIGPPGSDHRRAFMDLISAIDQSYSAFVMMQD